MSEEKIDLIETIRQNSTIKFEESEERVDTNLPIEKIHFTKQNYDFPDNVIVIASPFEISPEEKVKIKCKYFLILNKGNINNLEIEGSLIVRKTSLSIQNSIIHSSDDSIGGIVVITASDLEMSKCEVYDGNVPGFFIEQGSTATIEECHIHNVNHTLFATSISKNVTIKNSKFHDSPHNGVHSYQTPIEITNSEFYNTNFPSISASYSKCTIKNVTVYDIEQNGISLESIQDGDISNCTLYRVKATGISANRNSVCKFYENKFSSISGNAFHITDKSEVEIFNNTITDCSYPAFAILLKCNAKVHNNNVQKCDLSGMCIRNAKEVELYDNQFDEINDCGVSISDTEMARITKNKFSKCKVAAVECYNSSKASIEDNIIEDIGQCAFFSYARATMCCKNNTISNVGQCFARILYRGNGTFINNKITNCPKLLDGPTAGDYYFENNTGFENITNIESQSNEKNKNITYQKANVINDSKLCLKCHKNKRDCYLHPCGHQIYCHECAFVALNNKESCLLCRFPIEKILEGYRVDGDESRCVICAENPIDSIVLPCGHIAFCYECLIKWFLDNNCCPFCREEHSSFKKIIDLE